MNSFDRSKYRAVRLFDVFGNPSNHNLHRLVAAAFIPNPNGLPEVNHKDGDKSNNCVSNLEWSTHKNNMRHARKNNLYHKDFYFYHVIGLYDNEEVSFYCGNKKDNQLDIEEVEVKLKEMLESENISEIECEESSWEEIDNFLVYL
jgi:hypothetical protein